MRGFPSSAVSWNDKLWSYLRNLGNSRRNKGFKDRTRQVQPSDEGMYLLDSRQTLRVAQNVHETSVAAARDNNQSLAFHVADDALVVVDHRVFLPGIIVSRVVDRESLFE